MAYKSSGNSDRKETHYNKSDRPARKTDGDRPQRREGGDDKPPYKKRAEGDRPFGQRSEGRGGRPEGAGGREGRPDGDRPFRKREEGDRPYQKREGGGSDRPYQKREGGSDRPYQKREGGGDRPYQNREGGGDRPYQKREGGSGGSDRPYQKRSEGDKPYQKREGGSGDRPFRPRTEGDRPYQKREDGERKPYQKREDGDRKPYQSREGGGGDRPFRPRTEGGGEGRGGDRRGPGSRGGEDRPSGSRGGDSRGGDSRGPGSREGRGGDDGARKPFRTGEGTGRAPFRPKKTEGGGFHSESPTGKKRVFRKGEDNRKERASRTYNKKTKFERDDLFEPDEEEEVTTSKKWDEAAKGGPMTLNKYLAHSGVSSRRDAADMVKEGKVQVNGEVVKTPGYRVAEGDVITLDGKTMTPKRNFVYILLNKPKDFITTTEDQNDRRTVMDLVATASDERLYPVGRLDRHTTGVLLLTNDGDLTQKLSHPSYEVKKIYQVTLDKTLTKADFDKILEGVELEDGVANVDRLSYLEKKNEVGLEIHSGRNRIVRRIFEALGYEVVKLDRVMYAGLTKKNVSRGKWRYLNEKEVTFLKHFKN